VRIISSNSAVLALVLAAMALAGLSDLPSAPGHPARPVSAALPALPGPPALSSPLQAPSTRPRIRLFAPQDLGLLDAPDRELWQKPDQIMDALGIADGSVVADIGAAGGWFTVRLARRVGPNGTVYAEDIQPLMVEAINRRVQRENLLNVQTVLGKANDPRLPSGLDAVLIVDAYPEIEDPVALLQSVARALKPQGRLGVVDFTAGGGGPGPAPDERVDPQSIIKAATSAGLLLITREAVPPFQFLLIFGRDPTVRATP
jgi:SAM-dependent methyltransferase